MKWILTLFFTVILISVASASFGYDDSADKIKIVNQNNYTINGTEAIHNQLSGLQGGDIGEYYHLKQNAYDKVIANFNDWITNTANDLVNYFTKTEILDFNYWNTTYYGGIGNWSNDKDDYSTSAEILAFGYYNESDFIITDYFTKTEILNFDYYNSTDFSISDYFTSAEVLAFNYYNSTDFNINDYLTSAEILGFNYYNSTDFDINDYYTSAQIDSFNYYNATDFSISDYYTSAQIDSFNYINQTNEGSNITITGTGNSRTIGINMTSLKSFFDSVYQAIGEYFTKAEIETNYYNRTDIDDFGFLDTETDPVWIADKPNYVNTTQILAFGYYNESDFIITDYFTKTEILNFDYYNSTNGVLSQWTTSGSNIYYNSGNVGIGTTTPQTKLHVAGNAVLNGTLNMDSNKIISLANATAAQDAVTLSQLQAVNVSATAAETDPIFTAQNATIWGAIDSKYDLSNPYSYVNTTTASNLDYRILSMWENITNAPTTLSFFTDDLGNRGYTHLTNFSSSGFTITESQISDLQTYYLASNPDGFQSGLTHLSNFTNDGVFIASGTANAWTLHTANITAGTFLTDRIPDLDTAKITTGTFADGRISQSSVTQHQGALSITESQISDLQTYYLKSNPFSFYNVTTAPTYLNDTFRGTNYTTFLTHIDWAKVVNGTMMSQATYNTNYTTLAKLGAINTWTANQTLGNNFITNGTGGAYIRHNGTGWVIRG